jgi:hypothetical protein
MILRRVIKHVRNQEWIAIFIDFLIVVVGVFVGLQVQQWSTERTADTNEIKLLGELRTELENSIIVSTNRISSFTQVGEAAQRSLAFLETGDDCGDECWPIVVDFFHASQWQRIDASRLIFEEMRRAGLPRSRAVIEAVESYHIEIDALGYTMNMLPEYRTLVRGLIPLTIHDIYWKTCFNFEANKETYNLDCPQGVSAEVSARTIAAIKAEPDIIPTLTVWAGDVRSTPSSFEDVIEVAKQAIAEIDQELESRK